MSDLGKIAYDSFLHEAGFDKDARVVDYNKLASYHKKRWRTIAANVISAWKEDNGTKPIRSNKAGARGRSKDRKPAG